MKTDTTTAAKVIEEIKDIDTATPLHPENVINLLQNSNIEYDDFAIQYGSIISYPLNQKIQITTLREDINQIGRHTNVIYTTNWELYAETDVGIKYYVDTKSYFERNGNKYAITMQDTSTQGTDFMSLSMYFEIDCEKVRARPVRIFGYSGFMGDGEEVELSEKSDNVWMYATAGTPNGVLLDVMCGGDE